MVLNINHDDPLWSFKSQFGVQCSSLRRSAPACSFGTSPGAVHLPLVPSLTPSPQDYKAGFAPVTCNYPNKTMLRWSASNLARSPFPTSSLGAPPGPEHYRPCTDHMLGRPLPEARLHTAPSHNWMALSSRESHARAYVSKGHERENLGKHSPGPHTVGREAFSSIGQQVSSLRETSPRIAPARAARFMRFRSQEVNATPGPGAYNV
ncbi:hypothetical protein V8C86DRAFT_3139565 [Haematococcus lacustris]